MLFNRRIAFLIACLFSFFSISAHAMTSSNFQINWDSMNTGGDERSTSTNFQARDTIGESGTSDVTSTNFSPRGGYRAGDQDLASSGGSGGSAGGGGGSSAPSPPIVFNVVVSSITMNSARITWKTDKESNSSVAYGFTASYASGTIFNPALVIDHTVDVTGLTPATLYHFRLTSVDSGGLSASTGDTTFITASDTTLPILSNIRVENISDTSAFVRWDTNKFSSSLVIYGTTTAYGATATTDGNVVGHSVTLTGLKEGTAYHFFVHSVDSFGNTATSTNRTFTTTIDKIPPANVFGFIAIPGNTTIALSWANPSDLDFAGTRVLRKTGGFPSGPFDGTLIHSGVTATKLDTGLINGTTYFYGAYAFDVRGNFASGALTHTTPSGGATTTPPLPPPTPLPSPLPPPTPAPTPSPTLSPLTTPSSPAPAPSPTSLLTPLPSAVTPPPAPGPLPPGVIEPPISGPIVSGVSAAFLGNAGEIPLEIDTKTGTLGTLAGSVVLVRVPIEPLVSPLVSATVSVAGSLYALQSTPDGKAYAASFLVPEFGRIPAVVTVVFKNTTTGQSTYYLNAQPGGRVVEEKTGVPEQGVSGARTKLFRKSDRAWELYSSQQTGADGTYGFIVPNGTYYAEIEKEGYLKTQLDATSVEHNVFNQRALLVKAPLIQSPVFSIPILPIPIPIPAAARVAVTQVVQAAQTVRVALDRPEVQTANVVAGPALLGFSVVNATTAVSSINLLSYFQYLFAQPLLLFGRVRRKKWGVVFHSLTKQPVDLAIVRLLHAETKLTIQSKVTDKLGRFAFIVKAGKYLIEVTKPGYIFPTAYLAGKSEDIAYTELYQSGSIEAQDGQVLTPNIPIDPVISGETPRQILWKKASKVFRHGFALAGVPIGMAVFIITPTPVSALLLSAQIVMYLLFRRLSFPTRAKRWGVAFDVSTHKPIAQVIVRIFDKKFNKLLETQVTNKNGKYGFLVRRNVYYVTSEKKGYKKYTSPDIDLTMKDEAIVDQNLLMERVL